MFQEQDILNILKAYTTDVVSIQLLGISHNTVYKIDCHSPFILRITSSNHRSKEALLSEIDFLMYLDKEGANVNKAIHSLDNQIITEYNLQDEKYYVVAFKIAEGVSWRERPDDNHCIDFIGKELGKIHKASQNYRPINVIARREYLQSQHLMKGHDVFKKYDQLLYSKFVSFLEELKQLNKNIDNYGLTHGDYLFSNYNINSESKVSVFDFDECEYSWYISDIAMCIYYYLLGGNPSDLNNKRKEAEELIISLLSGYLQEKPLAVAELKNIDLFFRQRDYILLSAILEQGEVELNDWEKKFVEGALERIKNNKPFIDINLERICDYIYNERT